MNAGALRARIFASSVRILQRVNKMLILYQKMKKDACYLGEKRVYFNVVAF